MGKNRHHYGTDGRVRQVNHHQPPYARVQFPDVPIKPYHLPPPPKLDDKVQYTPQPPTQTSVGCTSIGDYLNGREFGFDPKNSRSSLLSPASGFFNRITHFLSKKYASIMAHMSPYAKSKSETAQTRCSVRAGLTGDTTSSAASRQKL